MDAVLGDIFYLGFAITIGPLPPIAAILLLSGHRGQLKGIAYMIGWLIGLSLLMAFVVFFVRQYDFRPTTTPSLVMAWAMLLAGLALFMLAYFAWRRRPATTETAVLPLWLQTLDQVNPLMALLTGIFFGLVSFKNLIFSTAAAAAIGTAPLGIAQSIFAILLFIAIATIGIAIPVYISYVKREQAQLILDRWVHWLSVNNSTIVCLLCLMIGARLVGDGLGNIL